MKFVALRFGGKRVYRLLIVTDDQRVRDMFASMEGWEAMGIKPPRLRASVEEAVECMHKHHIDAIAVDALPALEPLRTYLDENCPDMPIFQIAASAEEQFKIIRELYSLLTRLSADDSNDEYDDSYKLGLQRERWMRRLIAGMVPTMEELKRQLTLYRCVERPDVPCVLARLALPTDDSFMAERWHYGSDRLETALLNFFGRSHDNMRIHVAVVSLEEVRVLCYPNSLEDGISENAAYEYIHETIEQIERYLGLSLTVLEVRRFPGLSVFTAENTDAL